MRFRGFPIGVFIALIFVGFSAVACEDSTSTATAPLVPVVKNSATVSGESGTPGSGLPVMCGEGVGGNVAIPAGSFVVPDSINLEIECFGEDSKEAEALAHDVEDQFDPEDDLLGAITLRPSPFVFQEDVTIIIPLLKQRKDLEGHQVRLFIYAPQQPKPKFNDIGEATVLTGGWQARGKTDHFTTFVLIGPEKPLVAVTPAPTTPPPTTPPPTTPAPTTPPPTTPAPITEAPVVGENLINNASFEQDPELLWFVNRRNTDLSAGWSTERARTGTRSLSLSASKSAQQGWPGWFTTNTIKIVEGYSYTFSAWAFTSDGAGAWVSIDLLDANGRTLMGRSTGCPSVPTLGKWHMRSISVSASDAPGATQVRLGLQQCLNFTEGSLTTLFYDDVFFGILPP